MKIIYVGTGARAIGLNSKTAVELIISTLGSEIKGLGHEVGIIDIRDNEIKRNKKLNYFYIELPKFLLKNYPPGSYMHLLKKIVFSLKCIPLISRMNHNGEVDIIHIQNQYPGFLIMFFLKKLMKNVKFVYTSHTPFWTLPKKEFVKYYYKTYLDKLCMRLADRVIAIGHYQKEGIVEKTSIDKNKIIVIQNGVDINLFKPSKKNFKNNDKINIIVVARFSKIKNQLMIIKMIPEIIKKHKNLIFTFIGQLEEEDYFQEIKKFIQDNNISKYVNIVGPVENNKLVNYYKDADILLSASNAEGFPLTVLEAMATGCLLVLSDIGPHKEIKDNDSVVYFKRKDLKDLIKKLNKLLDSNNFEHFKKESLNSAKKNYTWKRVALDNLRVYNN